MPEPSLINLSSYNTLSQEDVVTLANAGLHTVSDLQVHFAQHDTFLNVPGIGAELEGRLLDLLTFINGLQHLAQAQQNDAPSTPASTIDDPWLDELTMRFGMSVRAYNICQSAGLERLSQIREFHAKHGSFRMIRNCGTLTQAELEGLLQQTHALGYKGAQIVNPNHAIQEEELALIFQVRFNKISRHARNLLIEHVGTADPVGLCRFLMAQEPPMQRFPKAGPKVLNELSSLRRDLLASTSNPSEPGSLDATPVSALERWAERNMIPTDQLIAIATDDGRYTLLRFLDIWLPSLVTSNKDRVLLTVLKQWGTRANLQEIGEYHGLTRERVRQILTKLEKDFPRRLDFIASLPDVQDHYHDLKPIGPLLVLRPEVTERLNQAEGTQWSGQFMVYLALVIHGKGHKQVQWSQLFLRTARSKELDEPFPMLVEADLIDPLMHICASLATKLEEKRSESSVMHIAFQPGPDHLSIRARLLSVLNMLLPLYDPTLQLSEDRIILHPNSKRTQDDLLEEVLMVLDRPSHVSVIKEEWERRFQNSSVSIEGIRSIVVRGKDRFFSIGRTSTYGLRKWETERKDLRGGTIRDIVEDELQRADRPLHLFELTLAVLRYRPGTTSSNIKTNLSLEENGRFILMPHSYIGLAHKANAYAGFSFVPLNGSWFKRKTLMRFVGRPLDEVTTHLAQQKGALPQVVGASLLLLVKEGRIILGPDERIIHVTEQSLGEDEYDFGTGELPFETS